MGGPGEIMHVKPSKGPDHRRCSIKAPPPLFLGSRSPKGMVLDPVNPVPPVHQDHTEDNMLHLVIMSLGSTWLTVAQTFLVFDDLNSFKENC